MMSCWRGCTKRRNDDSAWRVRDLQRAVHYRPATGRLAMRVDDRTANWRFSARLVIGDHSQGRNGTWRSGLSGAVARMTKAT